MTVRQTQSVCVGGGWGVDMQQKSPAGVNQVAVNLVCSLTIRLSVRTQYTQNVCIVHIDGVQQGPNSLLLT